jgi:hypothetical protein
MKKMSLILIIALIFGLSAMAFAAVVEDYSSTINVFKDSPAVAKIFQEFLRAPDAEGVLAHSTDGRIDASPLPNARRLPTRAGRKNL